MDSSILVRFMENYLMWCKISEKNIKRDLVQLSEFYCDGCPFLVLCALKMGKKYGTQGAYQERNGAETPSHQNPEK